MNGTMVIGGLQAAQTIDEACCCLLAFQSSLLCAAAERVPCDMPVRCGG